jgi:hypothetical protein
MGKISKVKSVQGSGTYDSKFGLLYKFEYQMEDNTVLTANHKTENSFKVGDEVEYEVKGSNDYGSYGSVGKPKEQHQPQKSKDDYVKGIEVGHAVNNAVNLICAGVELDVKDVNSNEEKIYKYAKTIMAISNRLKKET